MYTCWYTSLYITKGEFKMKLRIHFRLQDPTSKTKVKYLDLSDQFTADESEDSMIINCEGIAFRDAEDTTPKADKPK